MCVCICVFILYVCIISVCLEWPAPDPPAVPDHLSDAVPADDDAAGQPSVPYLHHVSPVLTWFRFTRKMPLWVMILGSACVKTWCWCRKNKKKERKKRVDFRVINNININDDYFQMPILKSSKKWSFSEMVVQMGSAYSSAEKSIKKYFCHDFARHSLMSSYWRMYCFNNTVHCTLVLILCVFKLWNSPFLVCRSVTWLKVLTASTASWPNAKAQTQTNCCNQ